MGCVRNTVNWRVVCEYTVEVWERSWRKEAAPGVFYEHPGWGRSNALG